MSASREKKNRQDPAAQGPSAKEQKRQQEEQLARRNRVVYTVIGVVCVVLVAALLIWNTGFFQSRAAAVTIDGQDYTAADVQYYYNNLYQTQYSTSQYYAQFGMSYDYDYTKSPKDQVYNDETGQTWHEYFLEQAVESLTSTVALANAAQADGYTLSKLGQAALEMNLTSLDTAWRSSSYTSLKSFIKANYGSYMTQDKLTEILTRDITASFYAMDHQNALTYSDAELNAYYQEHADELDTFVISQFTFQAALPAAEKDADGNTIERTEEETQQLMEQAKAEKKQKAEELKARLDAGEDPAALAEEYADDLASSATLISDLRYGSSVNSSYSEWAFNAARKPGDTTLAEYEGSGVYNYYVALFESRTKDSEPTADIRHILVSAGSNPTDEQYEQAKSQAEELLAQWQAGGAGEDDFAVLALRNSADSGSRTYGGLMTGVSANDSYVDTFKDWALDSARKPGDTGIIQNTGSSVKGYHIMYFVGWNGPTWQVTAKQALAKQDTQQWYDGLTSAAQAAQGSGLKYVKI